MEVIIKGTAREISDLIQNLQRSQDTNGDTKHNQVSVALGNDCYTGNWHAGNDVKHTAQGPQSCEVPIIL